MMIATGIKRTLDRLKANTATCRSLNLLQNGNKNWLESSTCGWPAIKLPDNIRSIVR